MSILEVRNISKIYTTRFGSAKVQALSDMNFSIEEGEYAAIMGESGSGKTTLLNILASLDKPTGGEVLLNGKSLTMIREKELSAFRRDNLGFVFQDFNLLDNFSLKDNILLPLVLQKKTCFRNGGAFGADCRAAWNYEAVVKIPIRGFGRTKTAGGGGAGNYHKTAVDSCRRADGGD